MDKTRFANISEWANGQSRRHGLVTIGATDGEKHFLPGTGSRQGDSVGPDDVLDEFGQTLLSWHNDCRASFGRDGLVATLDGTALRGDLSLTTFVDDLAKVHVLDGHNAVEAFEVHTEANRLFDLVLERDGLAQNKAKMELIPSLRKPAENKEFYRLFGGAGFAVKPHARHLGSRIAHDVFNNHEVWLRVKACETAWVSIGSFWWTADVPRSVFSLIFVSWVQSAAICGLEGSHEERAWCARSAGS